LSVLPETIDLSSVTSSDASLATFGAIAGSGPMGLVAAAGAALAGAALAISKGMSSGSKSTTSAVVEEPEPEPIDVSIPYDAAAAMAYCAVKQLSEVDDAQEFEKFKAVYEAFTVAEVTLKKASREYDAYIATTAKTDD